jgi:D-beta-D-heptose 7-phosphate kinase/D-beta-D-heptose 1-phosphate adenosyltransferase
MHDPLIAILENPLRPRILLVGDVMLDRYQWGDVERISPEAPIPVLRVSREEHRLGGAGNVAAMLATLDARPMLASVVGDDREGRIVRELLGEMEIDDQCVTTDPSRPTTVKERLLGRSHQRYPHHMMRVDRESSEPISAALARELLERLAASLAGADLVMVSDYNKGVCGGDFIPQVVAAARAAGVRVIADPVVGADYRRYAGCACISPNRTEAGRALGMKIAAPEEGLDAARRLLDFGVEAAAVTLDRDGIAWADACGNARLFAGRPRQVSDITGAGDMVLSAIGYAMAAGADYATTIELANLAGGLEVERLGVVPVSRREMLAELARNSHATGHKILPVDQLVGELKRLRLAGRRIAMTNGCFDLLHPGHVASLQEARRHGDCLVVGLNSDRSVRELKGPDRPVVDEEGRAQMLAALACVDYVVVFDETSVEGLVGTLLPDVLVKADQYGNREVVGHQIVQAHGGHVVTVPMKPHYSTSRLIEKSRSAQDCPGRCQRPGQ